MKSYERLTTSDVLSPNLPVVIRLDGKSFHTFCRGLRKPYDFGLIDLMLETTRFLAQDTNARFAYTQSDEISLVLLKEDKSDSQIYFNGKLFKIMSILASKCSVFFNKELPKYLPEKCSTTPVFDCRAFNLPFEEVGKYLFWRELDGIRNSISMAAQCHFSPKRLHKKKSKEMKQMLLDVGIDWHDYNDHFKYGTYFQRYKLTRKFTCEEIEELPAKHEAKTNPDLVVRRTEYRRLPVRFFSAKNHQEIIFDGANPEF